MTRSDYQMIYKPFFLMAVLVFGLVGNPSVFSNFDNKVESSINGSDFSNFFAFAQTENDETDETEDEDADQDETEDQTEDEVEDEVDDVEDQTDDKGETEDEDVEEEETEAESEDVDEESRKVTICHIPPGNPRKAHTITIDRAALERHLAHGDSIGECDDDFDKKLKDREAKLAEKEARLAQKQEEREARMAEKRAEMEARLAERQADIEERLAENDEKLQARLAEKQDRMLQRAEDIIKRLEQRIAHLEQRLQTMLERVESGEYFGRMVGENQVTNTYSLSFDGTASSLFDESVTADISGEIFLENLPTGSQITKFRVTGGEIVVGENIYDLAFGKARLSSGEKDSMVLLGEVIDFEGNQNTLRLTLDLAEPLEGEFESTDFEILPTSKISHQWSVSAQGQLSQVES